MSLPVIVRKYCLTEVALGKWGHANELMMGPSKIYEQQSFSWCQWNSVWNC